MEHLEHVVENWFVSPMITIEGYVNPQPPLARVAELYFQPDTETRVRELLRAIEMGFKVWPDNNGIFILTDKLDLDALDKRLDTPELNQSIEEAARRRD